MKDLIFIEHPDLVKLLMDTEQLQWLEPFFENEVILSDYAQEHDIKMTTLLYRVNKYVDYGILEVVREEARNGKAIKLYKVTAKTLFVPFSASKSMDFSEFFAEFSQREEGLFLKAFGQSLDNQVPNIGMRIMRGEGGKVTAVVTSGDSPTEQIDILTPDAPAIMFASGKLRLDFETAKALQHDMLALFQKYRVLEKEDMPVYGYRLGVTPID